MIFILFSNWLLIIIIIIASTSDIQSNTVTLNQSLV